MVKCQVDAVGIGVIVEVGVDDLIDHHASQVTGCESVVLVIDGIQMLGFEEGVVLGAAVLNPLADAVTVRIEGAGDGAAIVILECSVAVVIVTVDGGGAIFDYLGVVADLVVFGITDIEEIATGCCVAVGDPGQPAHLVIAIDVSTLTMKAIPAPSDAIVKDLDSRRIRYYVPRIPPLLPGQSING